MRSFVSTSKVIRRLVTHRNVCKQRVGIENHVQVRCLSGIVGVPSVSPGCDVGSKVIKPLSSSSALGEVCRIGNSIQSRGFLGCGDGEEGNMLTKIHEEKCVVGSNNLRGYLKEIATTTTYPVCSHKVGFEEGKVYAVRITTSDEVERYSPEQLYAVVAAVDLYEDFLPWCQRSEILRSHPDGSFDAELEIGFKFLVESYVSHVELNKPKYIKTTATDSGLFEHLINIWEFNPGPTPGSCNLHFLVDFKFHSPLYRQVANMFFKEVVSKLVGSFRDRCRLIYGPGVPIHEDTYQQRL